MKISEKSIAGRVFLMLALLAGTGPAPAQDWERRIRSLRPADVKEQEKAVLDNLERRAEEALAKIPRARTQREAEKARAPLRHQLQQSLGLGLLPWPPALHARVAGRLSGNGFRLEKIVYESVPGALVPAHLYLPDPLRPPAPAVLFYPGHWWADSKTRPDFQAFCINMARLGFVVLAWDPFGQGERGISTRDHRRVEALLVGISQQGLAAYETQCALQYLLSRKEVDPRRIGITGASGGGYNTWITAALDDRIAAAAPVVGTSEFFEQIHTTRGYNWDPNEHCHYVPGLVRYANNHELLAMAAPKPIRIITATEDREFSITGVRAVYEYGRELYQSYEATEKISLFEDPSAGHGYQQKKREAAYGWFLRWLMNRGDGRPYAEPPTETLPYDSSELRCLPPRQNQPAGPGLMEAVERLAARLPAPPANSDLKSILGLPADAEPARPMIRDVQLQRLLIPSEEGIRVPAFLLKPEGSVKGVLVAVDDRGKEGLASDLNLGEMLERNWAVCGVDPRGIGELATTSMAWISAVSLLLNENFVGRQALDLGRAMDYLKGAAPFQGKAFALYARGDNAALAAAYAIGSRRDLKGFLLQDGFLSFRQFLDRPRSMPLSFKLYGAEEYRSGRFDREIPFQYFVFNALRRLDLPKLLGSAPGKGLVVNPIDGDWNRMSEAEARKLLPARIRIVSEEQPEGAISRFLGGLL